MQATTESASSRELGAAALRYARGGWSVVPVHTPTSEGCSCERPSCPAAGKHPRIRWEMAMEEAAAEETIATWWLRWPDANVGVVTGEVSGVVVLDVDPRNGGEDTLEVLEDRWGSLPVTVVDRTGGGGWHYWFRSAGERIPSVELGPGLELKGEGGMVVAPPSRHVSGHRYRWLADPASFHPAPVPNWLTTLAHGEPDRPSTRSADESPERTTREQVAFEEAWARAGIELQSGDCYYHCPFHDDRHPSLHIDATGCRWFCFGCHQGGGIAALLDLLGEEHPAATRRRQRGRVGPRVPITVSGDRGVDVVGESYHQDALLEIAGGSRHYGGVELEAVASLVPDPDNVHDRDAVEVRIGALPVGHLRHDDAVALRPLIDESIELHGAANCPADIRGGWDRGRGEVGFFGVELQLPRTG